MPICLPLRTNKGIDRKDIGLVSVGPEKRKNVILLCDINIPAIQKNVKACAADGFLPNVRDVYFILL